MSYSGRELFGKYPVYLDNWRIAYQGCNFWAGGSACGIYTADTNGGQPGRATDLTSDIPSDSLGDRILFTANREGNWDVYVVNTDGSGLTRLTDHPGRDGLATTSPDFQHIAFVSDRDGAWAVYVMNVDGSNQQKLFALDGGYGGGNYEWYEERLSWGP
jgi:Tol biopolymer transport system component